jgi:hypothetical protein
MPNPLNLFRFAQQAPGIRGILQKVYAVAPDIGIGLPVEMMMSEKKSPKKEKAAALNTAAEIGSSLLLGGAETIPQLTQLATDPGLLRALGQRGLSENEIVKNLNARARTMNPSMYTEQLVEQIVEGKIDEEKERLMQEARERLRRIQTPMPTSGMMQQMF